MFSLIIFLCDNFEQKRPIAAYKTHSLLFYLLIKVLSHVMRNLNEFNIPAGNSQGYEILYFGVNLILMFDYILAFDVQVMNSDKEIQVLIVSRKDILAWKENDAEYYDSYDSNRNSEISFYYSRSGLKRLTISLSLP